MIRPSWAVRALTSRLISLAGVKRSCLRINKPSFPLRWQCSGAPDYERNGECVDSLELLGDSLKKFGEDAGTAVGNAVVEPRSLFFNLLVRIHFTIVMIRWTGLAPWEFEFPFPGSRISTFLARHAFALRCAHLRCDFIRTSNCDKYSGSMKITTHLDHISHCKTASGRIDGPIECLSWILAAIRFEPGTSGQANAPLRWNRLVSPSSLLLSSLQLSDTTIYEP